jgi:hypothetical protein
MMRTPDGGYLLRRNKTAGQYELPKAEIHPDECWHTVSQHLSNGSTVEDAKAVYHLAYLANIWGVFVFRYGLDRFEQMCVVYEATTPTLAFKEENTFITREMRLGSLKIGLNLIR